MVYTEKIILALLNQNLLHRNTRLKIKNRTAQQHSVAVPKIEISYKMYLSFVDARRTPIPDI
jgi:hypothetical protein